MKKRIVVIVFLVTSFSCLLQAQQIIKGPVLNPDLMTYFQNEMTSLMNFQNSIIEDEWGYEKKMEISPFYISGRYQSTTIEEDQAGLAVYTNDTYSTNYIGNGLIGVQLKIGEHFYIPFVAGTANYFWEGTPDDESLFVENNPVYYGWVNQDVSSYFLGSGLGFNSKTFSLAAFAGYYIKKYHRSYRGMYLPIATLDGITMDIKDEGTDHSLKILLVPDINTSGFKYIGNILNNIIGHIGMGDTVEIYTGETEKSPYENIAGLLNYGLNFAFHKFNFTYFTIEPQFYYDKSNYDALAREEVFGLSISSIFWKFNLVLDSGYINFYSVSPYFLSRYPNTGFLNIGLSYQFTRSSLNFYYLYDDVRKHHIALTYDINGVFSLLGNSGSNEKKWSTERVDVTETRKHGGGGLRYRYQKRL
jgi:hypothetical protein